MRTDRGAGPARGIAAEIGLATVGSLVIVAVSPAGLAHAVAHATGTGRAGNMVRGTNLPAAATIGDITVEVGLTPVGCIAVAVVEAGIARDAANANGAGGRPIFRGAGESAAATIVDIIAEVGFTRVGRIAVTVVEAGIAAADCAGASIADSCSIVQSALGRRAPVDIEEPPLSLDATDCICIDSAVLILAGAADALADLYVPQRCRLGAADPGGNKDGPTPDKAAQERTPGVAGGQPSGEVVEPAAVNRVRPLSMPTGPTASSAHRVPGLKPVAARRMDAQRSPQSSVD